MKREPCQEDIENDVLKKEAKLLSWCIRKCISNKNFNMQIVTNPISLY